MAEKRFVEFLTQNVDDGNLNSGFQDITSGKWYYTKDSENAKKICELLNELHTENQKLKDKLCELGVSDVKGIDTGLEDWLND